MRVEIAHEFGGKGRDAIAVLSTSAEFLVDARFEDVQIEYLGDITRLVLPPDRTVASVLELLPDVLSGEVGCRLIIPDSHVRDLREWDGAFAWLRRA